MCPCFSPGFWLFAGDLWLVDESPQSLASPTVYMPVHLVFPGFLLPWSSLVPGLAFAPGWGQLCLPFGW